MRIRQLVIREILYRKVSFVLGLVSVVVAVGCLVGALTILRAHDIRTQQILERKEARTKQQMAKLNDDMRKAMLKLGFNVVILPKEQNLGDWYADDYGSKYMSEEYVERLVQSKIVTIRHLLPSLQQKIKWPERKRTIILVGTRGEAPDLHANPKRPLVEPVPAGTMVLGYELHQSLGLSVGDEVELLGEGFTVHKCHEERGSKDDITVWIHLGEAQELLGKEGLINAILAIECRCAWSDIAQVRAEIMQILPDTQVIEIESKALARAEARMRVGREAKESLKRERETRSRLRSEREHLVSILVPLVMAACGIWIGLLAFGNVRERRPEIGILRALGLRSGQILCLFLSKAMIIGLTGGALGVLAGFLAGKRVGAVLEQVGAGAATARALFDPMLVILALVLAPFLSVVASWIPAMIASQQDPAEILREE